MSVQRVIPLLLYRHGRFVLSRGFNFHQEIGTPSIVIDRLKSWDVDEILIIDISSYSVNQSKRKYNFFKDLEHIASNCFTPITVGGGIRNIETIRFLLHQGADRILINSVNFENSALISQAAELFGSQAIVAGLDFKMVHNEALVMYRGGQKHSGLSLCDTMKDFENKGAGELFIQSIDNDGKANGFDLKTLEKHQYIVNIPIIYCGGAGSWRDVVDVLNRNVKAVGIANLFNFEELSYKSAKDIILKNKINIRPGSIGTNYREKKIQSKYATQFYVEDQEIWQELSTAGLMD